jgi:hypothetical protein
MNNVIVNNTEIDIEKMTNELYSTGLWGHVVSSENIKGTDIYIPFDDPGVYFTYMINTEYLYIASELTNNIEFEIEGIKHTSEELKRIIEVEMMCVDKSDKLHSIDVNNYIKIYFVRLVDEVTDIVYRLDTNIVLKKNTEWLDHPLSRHEGTDIFFELQRQLQRVRGWIKETNGLYKFYETISF